MIETLLPAEILPPNSVLIRVSTQAKISNLVTVALDQLAKGQAIVLHAFGPEKTLKTEPSNTDQVALGKIISVAELTKRTAAKEASIYQYNCLFNRSLAEKNDEERLEDWITNGDTKYSKKQHFPGFVVVLAPKPIDSLPLKGFTLQDSPVTEEARQ